MNREAFICPDCRTWFDDDAGKRNVRCPACGRRWAADEALLDSAGRAEEGESDDKSRGAVLPSAVSRPSASPGEERPVWDAVCTLLFGLGGVALVATLSTAGILVGVALLAIAVPAAIWTHFWTDYDALSDGQRVIVRLPRNILSLLFLLLAFWSC